MPQKTVVELTAKARSSAPDTIGILLSGNNYQTAAEVVINPGRVFKYLTIPMTEDTQISEVNAAVSESHVYTLKKATQTGRTIPVDQLRAGAKHRHRSNCSHARCLNQTKTRRWS